MQAPEVVAQETNELLQQCLPVFSARDDVAAVREVGRDITDMHVAGEGRHQEILNAIKGESATPAHILCANADSTPVRTAELTGQVQRSKQEQAERQMTLMDPTQKQQLLAERTRVEENIKRMQNETEGLRQRISTADSKAVDLSATEQQVRQQESVEVPRARNTISLYANISSIRWDYGSANVKGWITSSAGGGMKAFEMVRAASSPREPHVATDSLPCAVCEMLPVYLTP